VARLAKSKFDEGVDLSMSARIDERDMCLFRELYDVLVCFADDPQNSISRIGGGRISVPDDQANHLDHFLRAILEKYPDATDLTVVRVAKEIDAVFGRRSLGGEAFDESFWTNAGFQRHEDWVRIRGLARAFLIR
jgi:hypothetical protein